jgi:hypothetical protein
MPKIFCSISYFSGFLVMDVARPIEATLFIEQCLTEGCFLMFRKNGAGNRIRTGDPDLGKVVLYQLSYSR